MSDCFWCFINGVCEGDNCNNCKCYLSVNSEEGRKVLEQYETEVDEALLPVAEKWKKIKEQKNNNNE